MDVTWAILARRASMDEIGNVNLIGAGITQLLPHPQPPPRYETFTVVAQVSAKGDSEGAIYTLNATVTGPNYEPLSTQERRVSVPPPPTEGLPNLFLVLFTFTGVRLVQAGGYRAKVAVQAEGSTVVGAYQEVLFYVS